MNLNFESVKNAVINAGHNFFENGNYNLNLVGIRNAENISDTFNDWLCVLFYIDLQPMFFKFPITTDPGLHYRNNPISKKGAAIVKPGQYPGVWCIGFHRGEYKALVQKSPITVYRDNDKDNTLDIDGPTDSGFHGINCHRSIVTGVSKKVGRWSAGCQVFAYSYDFQIMMALCEKSRSLWGNAFTYTLLEENDFELIEQDN